MLADRDPEANFSNNTYSQVSEDYDGSEKLNKVREILFGSDLRGIVERLNELENCLNRAKNQLSTEIQENLTKTDHAIKTLTEQVNLSLLNIDRRKVNKTALADLLEQIAKKLRESDHPAASDKPPG